jgi:hypothetical protein
VGHGGAAESGGAPNAGGAPNSLQTATGAGAAGAGDSSNEAGAPDVAPVTTGSLPASCAEAPALSNVACEFYAYETYGQIASGAPYMEDNAFRDCYALLLANASSVPAGFTIDRHGTTFGDLSKAAFLSEGSGANVVFSPLPDGKIPPGRSAIVFLAGDTGRCPQLVQPLLPTGAPTIGDTMTAPKKALLGYAFHIVTDEPVTAFDVFPYSGVASGSTMLIPPASWASEHVAVDPGFEGYLQGGFGLVAREDNTQVQITPTEDIGWEDFPATPAFTEVTRTLNKGDILQVVHKRYNGTSVIADKPVGQWAMHQCFIMGSAAGSTECDNVHQSIPPLSNWGSVYAGVGHRARDQRTAAQENALWRVVGAVNGTTLSYSPTAPAGAPATLQANEEEWFRASDPFVVRSQDAAHPFLLLSHMTTCAELTSLGSECRGDSEMVPVLPPAQFLTSYTFTTHPLFPETNLVLVRMRASSGFADVNISCADAPLVGWAALDAEGQYEYLRLDLSRDDFASQGKCSNGWQHLSSSLPFSVTIWQWGSAQTEPSFTSQRTSLGYNGGSAFHSLNSVHPTPPTGP